MLTAIVSVLRLDRTVIADCNLIAIANPNPIQNSNVKLVVKVPLDATERGSCTSNYWDPVFPRLKCYKNAQGPQPRVLGPIADVQFPHL